MRQPYSKRFDRPRTIPEVSSVSHAAKTIGFIQRNEYLNFGIIRVTDVE